MKKNKFNIPGRKFSSGEKKMVSMRLPSDLMKALGEIAERKQWPLTEVVVTVLDQYAQQENETKQRK